MLCDVSKNACDAIVQFTHELKVEVIVFLNYKLCEL
jgi:hypothetical protein